MYLSHWNLREEPFQNVADPRFAYLSDQHQEGLARLIYIVQGRKLGGVLVGPYGVGKSMILELLARHVESQGTSKMVRLDVPPGGVDTLARQIGRALIPSMSFADVAAVLDAVRELVVATRPPFVHTVLAIDEAQLIRDSASLDFLHLLTNIRLPSTTGRTESAAFTIILAGHDQLVASIFREAALRQRLSMIWHLQPLNERQVIEYVEFRMRAAGGDIWVFDEDALREVALASGGIPRVINNLCDVALMMGYVMKATKITRQIVHQAVAEAGIERSVTSAVGAGEPA
ncbi:MAG: AAA family ATPase [Kiritimatiellae bacterium]|nr:AAA family ATPase [Kiritimatiellia bacterium]